MNKNPVKDCKKSKIYLKIEEEEEEQQQQPRRPPPPSKSVDFAAPADHRIKLKESKKKDKELARELKKSMEHEGDDYTSHDWCIRCSN